MWVDSHCHLQLDARGEDTLADAARDAGVDAMVCVGTDLESSRRAIEIAAGRADVFATVGLHPHDASRLEAEWEALVALVPQERVVAIGEAGFDLHYEHSPRAAQEEAFRAQVRLAHESDLPLVIHSREAWDDTFRLLEDEGVPLRTVFHCFTGGLTEARRALDLGAHLSFSGIVSFRGADDVRAAAVVAPEDRVLVETDAPYLAPVPHRGRPNEPAYVPFVGAALAAARGVTVEAIAETTAANARRVFRLERAPVGE
jgi:TatD DNase family protein